MQIKLQAVVWVLSQVIYPGAGIYQKIRMEEGEKQFFVLNVCSQF